MVRSFERRRPYAALAAVITLVSAPIAFSQQQPPPLPPPLQPVASRIKNLGTLGGEDCFQCESRAFDLNNFSRVVGISSSDIFHFRVLPFRTKPNQPISPTDMLSLALASFPLSPGWVWRPYEINDAGRVAGWAGEFNGTMLDDLEYEADRTFDRGPRAVLWDYTGLAFNLGGSVMCSSTQSPLPGIVSQAFGLNAHGAVAGWAAYDHPCEEHRQAVLFTGGLMIKHGVASTSEARDVNDSGNIVGSYQASNSEAHAFWRSSGSLVDLDTIDGCPGCSSFAYRINNRDQVVGASSLSLGLTIRSRAFLMDMGVRTRETPVMQNLGTLCIDYDSGCSSAAFDINDLGQIVGASNVIEGGLVSASHAFLYKDGTMTDLNSFLSLADLPQWLLTDARGIDDLGQIVGTGLFHGKMRAYLLTPPPRFIFKNLGELVTVSLSGQAAGLARSLRAKLEAAEAAIGRGQREVADRVLAVYEHQVRALVQSRHLLQIHATRLVAGAALIRQEMEEERSRS